jgi:hypothetical protein
MGLNNPKPVLHGKDHAVGATDPVPGLGEYKHDGVPIHDAYYNPGSLCGWWRLGDPPGSWPAGPTLSVPNFILDHGPAPTHNLSAVNIDHNGTGSALPSSDWPNLASGALIGGSANDGAMVFHFNDVQVQASETGVKLALSGSVPDSCLAEVLGPNEADTPVGRGHTVSCWLKAESVGVGGTDNIDPYTVADCPPRKIVSCWYKPLGGTAGGWWFGFKPGTLFTPFPPGDLYFGSGGGALYPGGDYFGQTWFLCKTGIADFVHVAKVFKKTGTNKYERTIYVNLAPVSYVHGNAATVRPATAAGSALVVGGGWDDDVRFAHCRGSVDELAIWTVALTNQQLQDIYNGRVINPGESWTTEGLDPAMDIPDGSLGAQKITGYPADPGVVLRGDGMWAPPTTGAVKLAETTGGSGTYPFTNLDPSYSRFRLVVNARGDATANFVDLLLRFNGDTGSNYSYMGTDWNGTAQSGVGPGPATSMIVGAVPAAAGAANHRGQTIIEIGNPGNTAAGKQVTAQSYAYWATGAGGSVIRSVGGVWMGAAAAISQMTLLLSSGSFQASSRAVLWGYT